MKIPYGISDFSQIREEGFFYADKTPFLPVLEAGYRHIVFLRPRRFGKSTLVSLLEHYYDLGRAERFDELFRGLWVHAHPTPERSRYLVLSLDFSRVTTDDGPDALRRTFLQAVRGRVSAFLMRYRDRIPPLGDLLTRLNEFQDAEALIGMVLDIVSTTPYRVYLLIDEYDHFANRLLAAGGGDLYETVVTKTGFVRTFYATLKSGTGSGAVARMFITGVSPLMLDDLSSGFNIATHASMSPRLNTLAGFTRQDTARAVDEFLAARPGLGELPELAGREALLDVLEQHYNGYRFSGDSEERVFNSDMVLYFLRELDERGRYPENMLDRNVRTEYGYLQRIGTASGADAAERRSLLQQILSEGHVRSEIVEQFGVKSLASETPFVSLLYFLGMLTLGPSPRDPLGYDLTIPNRVIRELQWEHLALMLEEEGLVTLQVAELRAALAAMVMRGEIEPFLDLFQRNVLQTFSNRDARGLDEKTIKLLLMTYASLGQAFYPLSEQEFAQGYGDLFLAASREVAGARYSWLLELKYLKAGAKAAQIEAAFAEAEAQVARYASDRALLPLLLGDRELKAGMIVFVGAKKALFRPWEGAAPASPRKGRKAGRGPRT
ncbi:MAG TPA: AAA family ATPase [Candidatus Nanopelagicales bacterium]|nr:AAA family ATPase [Candidatus Nanopelagicales bacterium]